MNHHILTTLGTVSRRRLLIGLLLVLALAGGLWWNSTRLNELNETEKQLVGVWEKHPYHGAYSATLLLPDRRLRFVDHGNNLYGEGLKWGADQNSYTVKGIPNSWHADRVSAWVDYLQKIVLGGYRSKRELARRKENEMVLIDRVTGGEMTMRRSTNPDLIRIYERLIAGESP